MRTVLILLFKASEGSNAVGGAGAGRVATRIRQAATSSRRVRSLAAAVARSTVWILENGAADDASVLIKIGCEIPNFLELDCAGCLERLKNDRFCLVCGSSPSQVGLDLWIDGADIAALPPMTVVEIPRTPLSLPSPTGMSRVVVSTDRVLTIIFPKFVLDPFCNCGEPLGVLDGFTTNSRPLVDILAPDLGEPSPVVVDLNRGRGGAKNGDCDSGVPASASRCDSNASDHIVAIVMRIPRPVAGMAVRSSSIIEAIPRCRVKLVPVQIANPAARKVRALPCSWFDVDCTLLLLPQNPKVKIRIATRPKMMVSRTMTRIDTGNAADLGTHNGANCGLVNTTNTMPLAALAPINVPRPYLSAGDLEVCATVQSRKAPVSVRAVWSKNVDVAIVP